MIREDIDAKVFEFFAALGAENTLFRTATRKAKVWEDVAPEDQPALLMRKRRENAVRRKGFPTRWTFNYDLLLYANTGATKDPEAVPSQILNPLVDAIEAALAVDDASNEACTLGGIVSHCAINGDIEIHEGVLGDEGVAIVPIEVLTTA
jgi:hypothetical protein